MLLGLFTQALRHYWVGYTPTGGVAAALEQATSDLLTSGLLVMAAIAVGLDFIHLQRELSQRVQDVAELAAAFWFVGACALAITNGICVGRFAMPLIEAAAPPRVSATLGLPVWVMWAAMRGMR